VGGDPPFESEAVYTIARDGANVSKLSLSTHAGTHVDAPYHYLESGRGVDEMDLGALVGRCQVISVRDSELVDGQITAAAVADRLREECVLLKTRNSQHPGAFARDAVSLALDAARLLAERGVRLVGTDGMSIERYRGDGSVHRALLARDVVIVETLDLSQVEPGFYDLICLPMKVVGADGAPARVVLRR